MENEKIFEFITKIYSEMKEGFKTVNEDLTSMYSAMKEGFEAVNEELASLNKAIAKIEVEHEEKLSALFDGYKQNSDKLDRIEKEVSKHDDFILKRVIK